MTSEVLYNTLLTLARKDKRGKSLSIDEFNLFAPMVNEEVYSKLYDKFEQTRSITNSLINLKVLGESVELLDGVGWLPEDFYSLMGEPRYTQVVGLNSYTRSVDDVTNLELSTRLTDALTQPTERNPICVVGGESDYDGWNNITVYPNTILEIAIDYLKTAPTPFIDYYVNNTTYVITFMAADDIAITIPTGSTYRDGTVGPAVKDSLTVDPVWGDDDLPLMIYLFLQKMGIQTGDINTVQYALQEEAKATTK